MRITIRPARPHDAEELARPWLDGSRELIELAMMARGWGFGQASTQRAAED